MGPHLWPVKTKLAIEEEGSMMLSTGKVLIFKDWVWGTLDNPKSEPDFYHSKGGKTSGKPWSLRSKYQEISEGTSTFNKG